MTLTAPLWNWEVHPPLSSSPLWRPLTLFLLLLLASDYQFIFKAAGPHCCIDGEKGRGRGVNGEQIWASAKALAPERDSHERKTWVEAEITRGDRVGLVKEDQFIFTQAYMAPWGLWERDWLFILHLITTTHSRIRLGCLVRHANYMYFSNKLHTCLSIFGYTCSAFNSHLMFSFVESYRQRFNCLGDMMVPTVVLAVIRWSLLSYGCAAPCGRLAVLHQTHFWSLNCAPAQTRMTGLTFLWLFCAGLQVRRSCRLNCCCSRDSTSIS